MKDYVEADYSPKVEKICQGFSAQERRNLQVQKTIHLDDTPSYDIDFLKDKFQSFVYPLHFIDFDPSTVAVYANNMEEVLYLAKKLKGHSTATIFGTAEDLMDYLELFNILQQKVGRLIFNNFPTGVEVTHAMLHGGPFPATTDSRSTSVGTTAIYRFTRPVCFQNCPDELLPDALKPNNPLGIVRLVDSVSSNH